MQKTLVFLTAFFVECKSKETYCVMFVSWNTEISEAVNDLQVNLFFRSMCSNLGQFVSTYMQVNFFQPRLICFNLGQFVFYLGQFVSTWVNLILQ